MKKNIFVLLKKLLFKKKQTRKLKQKSAEAKTLEQPKIYVIPEEEIKKRENERHKQYLQLIENIEKNRGQIIKEQTENELKIIPFENGEDICISLKKKNFQIDKSDYIIFENEFNLPEYTLSVHYSENLYYLVRINKYTGQEEYFHRFLMKKEIEDYCLNKGYTKIEVVVHHRDFCEWNNKRTNLQVMSVKEHNEIHHRE